MKTIFFDIDGIILNFSGPFSDFWNEGLEKGKWVGDKIDANPTTWSFGKLPHENMDELKRAMDEFYDTHDHLPVLDENIIDNMNKLSKYFRIELVSSYPNVGKRVENLLYHNIDYDKLLCNVRYKCEYIKSQEKNGLEVVAIFEDAPQHIDSYLPYYPNKIWSPNFWKYLEVYFSDTRINFYSSSNDWLQIVENK